MNELSTILMMSTIMWLIIDWFKPAWESLSVARYISIGVALVLSIVVTVSFNLDLLVATGLSAEHTVVGNIYAVLSMTAGSGLINEIMKAISSVKK